MAATERDALKTLAHFELTLDGPSVTAMGWEGAIDAPDGYSFGGQFTSIGVSGLSAAEFWASVIEMASLDGPELCADDRDEI